MNFKKLNLLIEESLKSKPKQQDCNCGCGGCGGKKIKSPILKESKVKDLLSEGMNYHIDNKISLSESEYKVGSEEYLSLIRESRKLYSRGIIEVSEADKELLETDLGHFGEYKGEIVPLDLPMLDEEELEEAEYQGRKVKLNKPMKGDVKKSKVYVKNPKGNVVKVNFGDPNMRIKKSDPERRRSFRARHNCDNPGPKHKARYWSCRAW